MSFLETVRQAKAYLEKEGRVSLSALRLEFGLEGSELEALVTELVDVQEVAARKGSEGKVLAWAGPATSTLPLRSSTAATSEIGCRPPPDNHHQPASSTRTRLAASV